MTAVGDPVRMQILFVLKGERMNVTEIASHFKVSRPAISHHLKVLRDANVVESEKIGQEVYYWVAKDYIVKELRELADILEKHFLSPKD
jgi:ArsR family transcriptional regulator, arsenate/arsenite/antimonite-responsive transcriptional repressor